jgi:hypothetical protein
MKFLVKFRVLVILCFSTFAFNQELPPESRDYCTPSHLHNQCDCLAMGGYKNCKEGKLETETQMCKSYCAKENCQCCKVMDDLRKRRK